LLATQRYDDRADLWNEQMSFNRFPSKPETECETALKTYKLFTYGDIRPLSNSFFKNMLKAGTP